ncbi:MAG TPA: LysE family translocator [Desulfopila sp.]|nr:LysE family translocator [Desulfopila sp.]
MDFDNWLLFSSIALVATITPGPAVLLVASHSIGYGVGRTVYTILGNITGLLVMSLLSVLGLSAVVMLSAAAFAVIKTIGALYLVYLGIRLWRYGLFSAPPKPESPRWSGTVRLRFYKQGLMVALSNPKAIIFTTALFPQFLNHGSPLVPQFTLLAATFMSYSFVCLFLYARISATTGAHVRNSRLEKLLSRLFASLFVGTGIGLVTAT